MSNEPPRDPFGDAPNPNAPPPRDFAPQGRDLSGPPPHGPFSSGTPGYGGGYGGSASAPPPDAYPPTAPAASPWPWIFGIVAVLGVLALVCCGGIGLIGYRATVAMSEGFGGMILSEVREDIENDPRLIEEIGEVQEITMDMTGSMNEPDEWLMFDVEGAEQTAKLKVRPDQTAGPNTVAEVLLVLESGEEVSIPLPSNDRRNEEARFDPESETYLREESVEMTESYDGDSDP